MFRATMGPSSGETTVFLRHFVLVILCGWLSSIQNNKYQVSHKYSSFSWWQAHRRPKHVEKRNKQTKKNRAPSWFYLQDYTGMHGQQSIKYITFLKRVPNLSLHEWKCNKTMVAEEYCWATTLAADRSRSGRWSSSVLQFWFRLGLLIYTYIVHKVYTQLWLARNPICAGPSET